MRRIVLLPVTVLLHGCFLREPSPVRDFHPKAELYLGQAAEASFSPDGKSLAFVRQDTAGDWTADVYLQDRESKQVRRLTQNQDYDGQPRWSPNSKLLVITSKRSGAYNLFLVSPSDGAQQQLTWNGGRQADFSPDGQSIVYASDELGSPDLFVTSPAGGVSRRITSLPGREWFPRYSPDGRWIVFVSDAAGSEDLWLMDRVSSRLSPLTQMPGSEVDPCWSPDSRWILFSHTPGGNADTRLGLFALAMIPEAKPIPLTHCEGLMCESLFPTFSPDGKLLLFTASVTPMDFRLASLPIAELLPAQTP